MNVIMRIGETRIMNNGKRAIIVDYRGSKDIDVQFEDNTIVYHKRYDNFRKGKIKNPNIKTNENKSKIRINEERTMNNGQKATIIKYKKYNDIDIQFEDGTIVQHRAYSNFRKGKIKNPNIKTDHNKNKSKIRINEERTMNNGQKAIIINYAKANDINIKFEDNTIVYHKTYDNFKKGIIRNPNIKTNKNKSKIRINEERTMNNGQKATIIKYKKYNDIDIQFEDGTIVYHKTYDNFKKGIIRNPNIKTDHNKNKSEIRINEERTMNNGQKAIIIKYRGTKDIDVQFEDNNIVCHKTYRCFRKGEIRNPNITINETKTMNNGQKATIIKYKKYNDIDIQFEDGTIVQHRAYSSFKKGKIRNPNIT